MLEGCGLKVIYQLYLRVLSAVLGNGNSILVGYDNRLSQRGRSVFHKVQNIFIGMLPACVAEGALAQSCIANSGQNMLQPWLGLG